MVSWIVWCVLVYITCTPAYFEREAARRKRFAVRRPRICATEPATAPPGTYYTRLRALNACGASAPSVEVPITLGCSATAVVPGGLTVTKAGGVAAFTWLPPLGATRYRMRVGTAPGLSNLADLDVGTVTALAVNLAGIAPGTYYVQVAAVSACGLGAPSNEVALSVP